MSETYGHVLPSQALRPAIFDAKRRLAVFCVDSFNKKQTQNIIAFRLAYASTAARAAVTSSTTARFVAVVDPKALISFYFYSPCVATVDFRYKCCKVL